WQYNIGVLRGRGAIPRHSVKSVDLKDAHTDDIVSMYRRAASAHLDATIQGNVRVTNNHAKVIVKCYRELRVRGETAQKIFITLLSDPNEGVRLWAGKHA